MKKPFTKKRKNKARKALCPDQPDALYATNTSCGMFFLTDPSTPVGKIFPGGLSIKPYVGFVCYDKECQQSDCTFKHIVKPVDIGTKNLEAIGDHFISQRMGWFNENSFRIVKLKPKYKALLRALVDSRIRVREEAEATLPAYAFSSSFFHNHTTPAWQVNI